MCGRCSLKCPSSAASLARPHHVSYVHCVQCMTERHRVPVCVHMSKTLFTTPRHNKKTHNVGNIGLVVVDFDDTCTEKDTVGVLLNAVVDAKAAKAPSAAAAAEIKQQQSELVKQLSLNYVSKQQQLLQQLLPQQQQHEQQQQQQQQQHEQQQQQQLLPQQQQQHEHQQQQQHIERAYDAAGLKQFCEALSDFDTQMNQVVIDAGVLQGERAGDESWVCVCWCVYEAIKKVAKS